MEKIIRKTSPCTLEENEESGDLVYHPLKNKKIQDKKSQTVIGNERRKRWSKNTQALLAMFNRSELLDLTLKYSLRKKESGKSISNQTVNDPLTVDSSEISEKPIKLHETESIKKNLKNDCKIFQLLKHEIKHLKEKFEFNDNNYELDDLMRFTHNSKKILKLSLHNSIESDKKIGESVYHDLECLRMTLEHKIGFCLFSKIYEKMNNIINGEVDSTLKNCLEKQINPMKTYVIDKFHMAGDGDDLIKNTWKSIVGALGDKKEYLPDVWELAMSENIYYHF